MQHCRYAVYESTFSQNNGLANYLPHNHNGFPLPSLATGEHTVVDALAIPHQSLFGKTR
jgi:hypothetical protein